MSDRPTTMIDVALTMPEAADILSQIMVRNGADNEWVRNALEESREAEMKRVREESFNAGFVAGYRRAQFDMEEEERERWA